MKDNLLEDKFDRTNKYDHAGRLTFNQFGMGLAVDGINYKRVYQQSLTYDGFSMMNSRSTTHWGNDSVFFETYTNGRITNNPNLQYDAAGNIVSSTPNSQNPHVFQKFDFDASGRRIGSHDSEKGRWGSILNMVTEKKDVIAFDGDGHPVVEKSGYQNYHAVTGTPPPAGWQPPIRSYQIWSTVLGGSLMTYHPANDYRTVNVYAGGAVIAEKTRGAENNQTVEHLGWKTSDPVTGTQAVFNQYGAVKLEEIEPLGQAIAFHDSSAPPEPSPNQVPERRNADDPHWQCEADKGFWGGFTGYPFHCQKKMIQDLDYELKNLYGWGEQVENPTRINYLTDSPIPDYRMPHSAADNMMAFALRATTKKTGGDDDSDEADYVFETREKGEAPEIPDFRGADDPGQINEDENSLRSGSLPFEERLRSAAKRVYNSGDCAEFVNGVLNEAYKLFPNKVTIKNKNYALSNIFEVFNEVSAQGGFKNSVTNTNAGAEADGYRFYRTAVIGLNPEAQKKFERDEKVKWYNSRGLGRTIIHELMHQAGGVRFTDKNLAEAVAKYLGITAPNYEAGNSKGEKFPDWQIPLLYSSWWNVYLKDHCK